MISRDEEELERIDARNTLDKYVCDLRRHLSSKDASSMACKTLSIKLRELYDWLYEEGENCKKKVYEDKLAFLKVNFSFKIILREVIPKVLCHIK